MESKMDKRQLRKQMQERRNALTKEEQEIRSTRIAKQLLDSTLFVENTNICIYQAFRNEVSCDTIKQMAWRLGKTVYVPITDELHKKIEFYPITEQTSWHTGAYGILEPIFEEEVVSLTESALILMPGLVFDSYRHRIGYGGGYYDKYLADHPSHTTVALCYDFQIIPEELPYEEHDILPDYIITEHRII